MLRKIYCQLTLIVHELQAIRKNLKLDISEGFDAIRKCEGRKLPVIEEIKHYADNEIFLVELLISLTPHDLYKLKSQHFYQELVQYLENLQIQKKNVFQAEKLDSEGTVEYE